ncbi:UV excision repair protein RAD23 homolog B [Anastrepha obliqua]|uniref:UV excision repair protein RAD23 homolog B n=1 Tax=Anastrepha obliqua TaxID=95512 RepID=UPI00240A4203|nr:UV excision repair protein RAD23 homolog B [Anastrepha obliqua]
MKLQIKTLSQKSVMVDIDASKTVYELKKELSLFPDVGVKPELQKLIYAGKVLFNEQPLSAYNIDAKKFLVVMVLKQPEDILVETAPSGASSSMSATGEAANAAAGNTPTKVSATPPEAEATPPQPTTPSPAPTVAVTANAPVTTPQRVVAARQEPPQPTSGANDEMVANIVSMGYPEVEVRRALAASFNNPERAIEYLIEGIPDSVLMQPENVLMYGGDSDAEVGMSPFEMFRSDPLFRNLRRAIQQHPELINDAIQRVGEANPAILQLINENQQEFLSSLIEGSDDDDDDDEGAPGGGGN